MSADFPVKARATGRGHLYFETLILPHQCWSELHWECLAAVLAAGVEVSRVSRIPADSGGEVLVFAVADLAPAHSDAEVTSLWLTLREMHPLRWADGDAEVFAVLRDAPQLLQEARSRAAVQPRMCWSSHCCEDRGGGWRGGVSVGPLG